MSRYIFYIFLFVTANGWSSPDLNELLDEVLDLVRQKIVEMQVNEIPMKNVDYDFTYKLWFVNVYGNFKCSGGKVRSLSSVYRTGESAGKILDDGISLEAPLGLRVLLFSFDHCTLQVKDVFTLTTPVEGRVGSSSIDFKVTVKPENKTCKAVIDQLELQDLSQISITTGTDILARLRDEIINGLIWRLRGYIFTSVSSVLKEYEKKEFDFTDLSFFNITASQMAKDLHYPEVKKSRIYI